MAAVLTNEDVARLPFRAACFLAASSLSAVQDLFVVPLETVARADALDAIRQIIAVAERLANGGVSDDDVESANRAHLAMATAFSNATFRDLRQKMAAFGVVRAAKEVLATIRRIDALSASFADFPELRDLPTNHAARALSQAYFAAANTSIESLVQSEIARVYSLLIASAPGEPGTIGRPIAGLELGLADS